MEKIDVHNTEAFCLLVPSVKKGGKKNQLLTSENEFIVNIKVRISSIHPIVSYGLSYLKQKILFSIFNKQVNLSRLKSNTPNSKVPLIFQVEIFPTNLFALVTLTVK